LYIYIVIIIIYIFFSSRLDRRGRPAVAERNPMALGHRRSVFHHDHRWVHSARRAPRTSHTGALRVQHTRTTCTHTHTHTICTVHELCGYSFCYIFIVIILRSFFFSDDCRHLHHPVVIPITIIVCL